MSKLFSLIRAAMSEGMHFFTYRSGAKQRRRVMPIVLAILVFGAIFICANTMTERLSETGSQYTILSIFVLATTVLTIMEGVYKSGDLLFACKDNDMLLSLPIRRSTIVFIRILKFYLFEIIYNAIFLIPAILAYALNAPINASYWPIAIVMILLLPVIPITISCVVGAITSAISSRFRQKSILQVVLSFVSLAIITASVFVAWTLTGFNGDTLTKLGDKVIALYYPAAAFVSLVADFGWIELLKFIIINSVVLLATVALISKFYFPIVTNINVVQKKTKSCGRYAFKKRGQIFAMVKKELVRYFSTPVLLTNTAMGLVLFAIAVVVLCMNPNDAILSFMGEDSPIKAEDILAYMPSVTFALVAFSSLMTFITPTAFSLEGKTFNFLKSLPISGARVIFAKILASVLLIIPITAAGSLAMFFRFQFSLIDLLLIMVTVIMTPLVTEAIGAIIGLRYASFDGESDAAIVKQSPGVMVSSFLSLGITIATISIALVIMLIVGQTVALAIMDGVFVTVFLILCLVLSGWGEDKYTNLAA